MTLALDTNVIVDIVRARNSTIRKRFDAAVLSDQRLVTSLVVLHELEFGCRRHPRPDDERARVRFALNDIELEPFDEADMIMAAKVRADLANLGRPVGAYDLLIASQALARDWTLITANTGEFSRVEGLKVIDWTAS